jgi:hypothetical protein
VENDLGLPDELPLKRYLVKTGKYREDDESKSQKPLDGVFDTFAEFIDWLSEKNPVRL